MRGLCYTSPMKKISLWIGLCVFMLMVVIALFRAVPLQSINPLDDDRPTAVSVVRIYYDDLAQIKILNSFDLFEYNNRLEKYLLAAVDEAEVQMLQTLGFRVEIDARQTEALIPTIDPKLEQDGGIPGYACYRTVEETFATAVDIVAEHPTLASWSDIGDSWDKIMPGGEPGYDLMVLKLTNQAIPGPKPVIFIMTGLHAREYAPPELSTRFAELLAANYGINADITWLLDYHEIHLLLQANPDGRKYAETGLYWRKNTNQNYCSPTSNNRGADLNRNFEFQWGCCNGSSPNECDGTYRGPAAVSEPEVQSIQAYERSIFPDQREDDFDAAAPDTAMGVFLDVHSFGQEILWPWGWGNPVAPNGIQLQTLGRKLAYFNNYAPFQAVGLYPTDGTSDDFAYGDLGVAAFNFEIGTTFFQDCVTFENQILPDNLEAFLYAAKTARMPYLQPAGPDVATLTLSHLIVAAGTPVDLTAQVDDTRFNHSEGEEPTQLVSAAEYFVDVPFWDSDNNPVAVPMDALDGAFNGKVETAVATIDTSEWTVGKHTIFVRGQDSDGNWGVVTAVFLEIEEPIEPPQEMIFLPIQALSGE